MPSDDTYLYGDEPIEINAGRAITTMTVRNTGDRAVQVGSHYHFFEANRALSFDRDRAFGRHLDIAAGTAVRFEPGDARSVDLVEYGGGLRIVGFAGLLNGGLRSQRSHANALARVDKLGFGNVPDDSVTERPAGTVPDQRGTTGRATKSKKSAQTTRRAASTAKKKGKA